MFLGNVMLEIALVSVVMVSISQILQRKFIDRKAMKESQQKIKDKQKKIKELMGKEDKQSREQMERLQQEMMELMTSSMQGTMKHMVVSFPIFIAIFWLLSISYSGNVINMPTAVPVIHRDFSFEITSRISWLWWYIYSSLMLSIVFQIGLKIWKKSKENK